MWDAQTLAAINKADDLKIAPYYENGTTGTPTWIWQVIVENALYVRAYNGLSSRWYQSAIKQKSGIIIAAGKTHIVTFDPIHDDTLNDKIDIAYHTKYNTSPYLGAMTSPRVKAATIRICKAK